MTKISEKPIGYRYRGAGEYVPGIPARDLTEADIAALTPAQLAELAEAVKADGTGPLYTSVVSLKAEIAPKEAPHD